MAPLAHLGHVNIYVGAAALVLGYLIFQNISLYLSRRRFQRENGCKPGKPHPHKDPILGLDLLWENIRNGKAKKLLEAGRKRFEQNGPTFTANLLGQRMIATIEPENVKTILSIRFKDYRLGLREETLGPLFGKGIFTTDGEPWAHSRAMIRPNFSRDQVANLDSFEDLLSDLVKQIPRDGSTVDLQELFFCFTIDSATEFLFGESVHTLRHISSSGQEFAAAFSIAQDDAAYRVRIGPLRNLVWKSEKVKKAIDLCHSYVDQFVQQALDYRAKHADEKESKRSYVFLHELARQTGDKQRLRDELLNVLLAGRDTTASLLSLLFYKLARRPDVWAKLRAEVNDLDGQVPTYETLRNMKYLKYCLNETLRLYPIVPGNGRQAVTDTVLPRGGGPNGQSPLFVSKGTMVTYNPYSMHRRKDYFGPDAEEFKPERWETLRPGWEYLPFNGGPRICIGQQYALTEASYVTVRLLQLFKEIEPRDDTEWFEAITLTLVNGNGCKVALTPA